MNGKQTGPTFSCVVHHLYCCQPFRSTYVNQPSHVWIFIRQFHVVCLELVTGGNVVVARPSPVGGHCRIIALQLQLHQCTSAAGGHCGALRMQNYCTTVHNKVGRGVCGPQYIALRWDCKTRLNVALEWSEVVELCCHNVVNALNWRYVICTVLLLSPVELNQEKHCKWCPATPSVDTLHLWQQHRLSGTLASLHIAQEVMQ